MRTGVRCTRQPDGRDRRCGTLVALFNLRLCKVKQLSTVVFQSDIPAGEGDLTVVLVLNSVMQMINLTNEGDLLDDEGFERKQGP